MWENTLLIFVKMYCKKETDDQKAYLLLFIFMYYSIQNFYIKKLPSKYNF